LLPRLPKGSLFSFLALWYILFAEVNMSARILIIEDDEGISRFLRRSLVYEGYQVDVAGNGQAGLNAARDNPPDLVVLDLMLPGVDGLEVCRRLRTGGDVPILILTAKDGVSDRVLGLDMGADDYMVKPFDLDELLARVRALLRRSQPASSPKVMRFSDLSLDTGTRQALRGDRVISLTAKEYELLELFMRHPRQVLTRDVIFDRVWAYDFGGESNIIEVYIRYLRQKLEFEGEDRLLHTVRGVGYVLREPD
jgi:two-component system response regulator MprA